MNRNINPTEEYILRYRESVGKQIRILREKKGLSQDDLSEIMNVHRSTISKVETGKFAITIDYLVKFSWHLGFELTFIDKVE
jgi:transcriptional regulator with XRE-family HTH domain